MSGILTNDLDILFYSEMQGRILDLIGRVTHDEITAELLRINDELNNLFLRYQRYEKNRDPKNASTPSAILGAALRGKRANFRQFHRKTL